MSSASHNEGPKDPMTNISGLSLQYPVQGRQEFLWNPGHFNSSPQPGTAKVEQISCSQDGLVRVIQVTLVQSPPEFRFHAGAYARKYNKNKPGQRRPWNPFMPNETKRIKELVEIHGNQWTMIKDIMAAEGYPDRLPGSYHNWYKADGKRIAKEASSTPDSSSDEGQDAPSTSAPSTVHTDMTNMGS